MDDSIRRCHDHCFRAFKDLCTILTRETEHQEELSPEDVGDLFGRFNVWAGNIGAGQRGQASLDFRLREATSIKEHVVGTLQNLLESLEDATSIVSGSRLPYDQLSSDSDSSTSSLSNSSIQDDLDLPLPVEQLPVEDRARTELQQLQHSIATFVSNLYKISIIIRQSPTPHDRNTKAFKIDTSFYETFDKGHVKAKYPDAKEALTERLGLANSRRRKYFKYREQHRQKLSRQDATKDAPLAERSDRDGQNEVNQDMLPGEQKTAPSVVQPVSEKQPTATVQSTKASTFYAHDISPINIHTFEQHSEAGTNTTFGSVSSSRQERLTIPPIPESAQGGREFECPYCYTICCLKYSANPRQEREWKRHVLRDLQPYICTFGGCTQADTMFERRRDWFGHELQVHRVEWCCNTPGHQSYSTRDEFRIHLGRHDEKYDDDQLGLMIDMFKRPAMQSNFACPICKDDRYQSLGVDKFEEHLGRHLEMISTFALPSDGGIDGSSDSIATEDAVHNNHSNTDTSSSNPSHGIMVDDDADLDGHGDKAHAKPFQDDTERFDGVQEPNGQDPNQFKNAVQESYEDWSFIQSIENPRQPEPSLNLVLAVPQASESDFIGGDRSINGENNSRTRNTLDALHKWLAADDQSGLLAQTSADRSPGTAEWIFVNPSYLDLRKGVCRLLLLEGLPGCGKTILCSSIVQNLRRASVVCAFYLFQRFTDESAMDAAVKALIHQLITQAHDVPTDLLDNIDDRASDLDALLGGSGARMLATSRFDLNIEDAIRNEQVEPLSSAELQWHKNINILLITREVVHDDIIHMVGSSKYHDHKREIGVQSKGIFMWASGRLQQLDQGIINNSKALGMTMGLAAVPPPIRDLWKAILDRIWHDAGGEYRFAVADILCLLSVSLRGLDTNEVHDYLSYDRASKTWGKYHSTDSLEVWRRFPALLQLTGQPGESGSATGCTDNLGFIHPSLQEIILSYTTTGGLRVGAFAINPMKAEEEVATTCVSHLLRYKSPGSYTSKRGWNAYAGQYWRQHIQKQKFTASKELTAQCIKLLDHQTPSFTHWTYMTRCYGDVDASEDGDFATNATYPSPIYYAALLDLYECAVRLRMNEVDVNARGGSHEYPIVAAVVAGAERIVILLASAGKSAEPKNAAALKAVVLGRPQILKMLLRLGADVSYEKDAQVGTLAHQAVKNDDLDCLRILAEYSADLDARDISGKTPLHLASGHGRVSCMQFLLSKGVNIEARDNDSHSPLLKAAKHGQELAFMLLIQRGAEIDACTEDGTTALCYGSAILNLLMVKDLIQHGANPNGRLENGPRSTPLHMAVDANLSRLRVDHIAQKFVVQTLLDHGANPNIPDEDGNLAETKTSDPELKELLGSWKMMLPPAKKIPVERLYASEEHHR